MSTPLHDRLAANLAAVECQIASACRRAGRERSDVQLVAVVKYAHWDWVLGLIDLGVRDLAENRPQQLVERSKQLQLQRPALSDIRWHLIGHLQRNKVRPVIGLTDLIHSIDSLRLLERVDQLSAEQGLSPRVLLEVNVSGEASKDGFSPEQLRTDWPSLTACSHVRLQGLMTMAPESDDPGPSRTTFTALRELRAELAGDPQAPTLPHLSMGMSGDFETAIEAGATLVRIGSRLFEGCDLDCPPPA